jgi:translation elongation factor EF-1alpha
MINNVALLGGEFVGKTSLFSYIINSGSGKYVKEKSSTQLSKKFDDFFGDRINDECLFLSTIYKNTTINFFDTKYEKKFIQNLYKKLLHCDSVILVLDIRNNTIADIYTQLTMLYVLGMKHIVFAFNKIDIYSFSESKNRFMKLRRLILNMMKEIGLKKEHKYFVPISAYIGDNVRKPSGLKWYDSYLKNIENVNEKCGTLLDLVIKKNNLDQDEINTKAIITKTYFASVPIFTGIVCNKINKEQSYFLQPGNIPINIKLLQDSHEDKEHVTKGDNLAFTITDNLLELYSDLDLDLQNITALTLDTSPGFTKFVCKIFVKNIPKIKTNVELKLNFHTPCKIKKIFSILDKDENNILTENTSVILQNQTAIALIETDKPIHLEVYAKQFKQGRIILQNNLNEIVGFGIVKGIK